MKRAALLSILFLTFSTQVFAESRPTPTPEPDTRPFAKDTSNHDPSLLPKTTLNPPVKQQKFAHERVWDLIEGGPGQLVTGLFRLAFGKRGNEYRKLVNHHSEDFNYLKIHSDRYTPKRENGPALVNAAFDFEGVSDKTLGYCWGFATLVRNFTTLAFYAPDEAKNPSPNFYKDLIDRIADGEAAVIPGYANFRELSLVPEFQIYLRLTAMNLWRDRAIQPTSGIPYYRVAHVMKRNQVDRFLDQLETRLGRGELPKIIIGSKLQSKGPFHSSKYIHVILPFHVERHGDGSARISVWDINFYTETLVDSPKFIEVEADGTLRYDSWREPGTAYEADSIYLSHVMFAPEDRFEIANIVTELKRFCAKNAHPDCAKRAINQ